MSAIMDINWTKLVFVLMGTSIAFVAISIHCFEGYIPLIIRKTYKYGKYAEKKDHFLAKRIEIPKRWFQHFYVFAAPLSAVIFFILLNRYFFNGELPEVVRWALDFQMTSSRRPLVPAEQTFLAMLLITIQCWKRLYETTFVSVFSDAKLSVSLYLVGHIHYLGTITAIVGESEGFVDSTSKVHFDWNNLTTVNYLCAFVFLTASYLQLRSNYILSSLRKNKTGTVVTKSYKIPKGELFDFISGPLQFTEITMYLMLSIILWKSSTYHWVFYWVLLNQFATAFDSHVWYRKTFKDYPKDRKIIVPFLI